MSDIETTFIYSNSESAWVSASKYAIPNRGINFGDGLFETMVFDGKKIRFFGFHLDRIRQGMRMLSLIAPGTDFSALEHWMASTYPGIKIRIRWNVFRAGLGKYTPESHQVVQTLHLQELTLPPQVKFKASFSEQVFLYAHPWSRFKTLNGLPYVLAGLEKTERNLDELILLDTKGKVAEASAANIFWRRGKKVFTPSLSCGGIAGVARRAILDKLKRFIEEGEFTSNELLRADQVWVSNVTGISYLEKIDSIEFSTEDWEPLLEFFE